MVLHHLDIPEALGPHDPQHVVRLTDAHFKIQPAAGSQGLLPLLGDAPVEVQAVLAAVQGQMRFIVLDGGVQRLDVRPGDIG